MSKKCPKCSTENQNNSTFCSNCGTKLKNRKTEGLILGAIAIIILFILFTLVPSSPTDDQSDSDKPLTENQYIANVNHWVECLDTTGDVTEGKIVYTDVDPSNEAFCGNVLTIMMVTVPPARYATYHKKLTQATSDRFNGLYDMSNGKENGDHALYNQGKALVAKSASEFKSISNQTEEMTTWN